MPTPDGFAELAKVGLVPVALFGRKLALEDWAVGRHENIADLCRTDDYPTQRDALAAQTLALLEGAEFHNTKLNEPQMASLTIQAQTLIKLAQQLAATSG